MGIYGQDWSSYTSANPSTTGLSFAFTKITEGTSYINPSWQSQSSTARGAGLVFGGYHYPHMANSAVTEAEYFLSQVAWQAGDLIILDWEGYDFFNAGIPYATQSAYKDAWLAYVKAKMPGHPVGTYCNTQYLESVDGSGKFGDFLWIATSGLPAGQPGISQKWLFHQYNDNPLDADYCSLGSLAELHTWALSFSLPPANAAISVTPTDRRHLDEEIG